MKPYSITRRVVSLVLLVEIVAAICVTAFAFVYERHAHFRSFDVGMRGRADTIFGAVEDADDSKDGVVLNTTDLQMPRRDVYAVREEGGSELGRSANWTPDEKDWQGADGFFLLRINGHDYRGLRLRGVRTVDPKGANIHHPLLLVYASPTHMVWEAVFGAVEVFALANGLLLLATILLVPPIVRRSMQPIHTLAADAGAVTASAWHFAPAEDVRQVAELRPLVDAMEGVLGRLELSFNQQRQFVGDAAHELKTAVAVVKSSIQVLELRARTPLEYEEGLKRTFADCLRMEDLAQKMLLLARIEEATPADDDAPTALEAAIRSCIAELTPMADMHGITLQTNGISSTSVAITQESLRSLLTNLVTNAIQHSADGSTVHIDTQPASGLVELLIKDHGEGVDPAVLPFVFDRFYRGDASRSRKTGGTGLGLAICKAIVERAGGTIEMGSLVGSGTTVRVTLPVMQ